MCCEIGKYKNELKSKIIGKNALINNLNFLLYLLVKCFWI